MKKSEEKRKENEFELIHCNDINLQYIKSHK
jgi:hypothetical protein